MSTEFQDRPIVQSGQGAISPPPRGGATTSPSSSGVVDQVKHPGDQAASTSHQPSAQPGIEKAAAAAEVLAETLRDRASALPGDRTTDLAYQAADTIERGASYVRDADMERMRGDVEEMIRKYPVQSIAVGLAAGFLLARMFR